MNNKGQVLIFFVLIIPLLMLGAAYIVDNVYISYHTNKLNQINSLVIKDASINSFTVSEIEDYVKKNDQDIEVELISIDDSKIEIRLNKTIKSFFGNIIGKNSYTLTSFRTIDITNEDLPLYQ